MAVNRFEFSGLVDTRNAKNVIRNADGTKRTEYFPNMDYLYGPYNSLQEAFTALSAGNTYGTNALVKGKTVGIINTDGEIEEYWFKKAKPAAGYTVDDLEEKGGSTPVDLKELTVGDTVKSFGTIFLYDGKVTHHRAVYHTTDSNDAWDVAIHPTTGSYNNNHETIFCCEHDAEEDGYESGYRYYIFDNAGMKLIGVVDDSGEDSEVTNGVPQYIRVAFGENLQDEVDALKSGKAPYPTSKTDGKQYVMKNGVWVEVDIKTDADGISYTKDAEGNTDGTVGKALDSLASGKAAAVHSHSLSDVTDIEAKLAEASASAATATTKAGEASASATAAATSESNAAASETNAKESEDNAKESEDNAAASAHSANLSKVAAALSEDAAQQSAVDVAGSVEEFKSILENLENVSFEDAEGVAAQVAINTATLKMCLGADKIEAFSTTKQYSLGDLVKYNNKLYKFTALHLAGAWENDKVQMTTIYEELLALKDAGNEVVTIRLSVDDTEIDLSDKNVDVNIYKPDNTLLRTDVLTTNEYGYCYTTVEVGNYYKVNYPAIEGYTQPSTDTYSAIKGVRNIVKTYKSESLEVESEEVTVVVTGAIPEGAKVTYSIDGVEYTAELDDEGKATFSVATGVLYTVQLKNIAGYFTSTKLSFIANMTKRTLYMYYLACEVGFKWTMADGTLKDCDDSDIDTSQIVGLHCSDYTMILTGTSFTIPLTFLIKRTAIQTRVWGTQVDVPCLKNCGSEAVALTDYNGETNTVRTINWKIECNTNEEDPKNYTFPAMEWAQNYQFEIAGVKRQCFLGAYYQMKFIVNNMASIKKICTDLFGEDTSVIAVNSGNWWTSSEFNATFAVYVINGSFYNYGKNNSYSVLPLLAY